MKHRKILFLFAAATLFFTFCRKDFPAPGSEGREYGHGAPGFNWSADERAFFSLVPRTFGNVQPRGETPILYHPLLMEAYGRIAKENQEHAFAEAIVRNTGLPVWSRAFVHCNPSTGQELVLVPLAPASGGHVSGFISLSRKNEVSGADFVINAMSRTSLLDTASAGNPWQKAAYTEYMLKYDHLLFGTLDDRLKAAYCHYRLKLPAQDPSEPEMNLLFPPPPKPCTQTPAPNTGCQWRILEVCVDTLTQNTWFGGTDGPLPNRIATWFDGDHDDDGIQDEDDQDYQQWHDNLRDWWERHYPDDFDDIFDGDHDNDGISDEFDLDWPAFLGGLGGEIGDILDGIGDWFDDTWGNIEDWWYNLWHDDHCWDGGLRGGAEDRDPVVCDWFYVLDCGAGAPGVNWYETFAAVVPCPECPGYLEYQNMLRDRMNAHYLAHYDNGDINDFWNLYNIALDCDAYSPCFEECVDEKFAEAYFRTPPGTPPLHLPEDFNNCFKSATECPTCTYTATLYVEQPKPGARDIYVFNGSGSGGSGVNSGHTFLSLNQYDPAVMGPIRTKTFGFYPNPKPSGKEETFGFFHDEDENSVANISVTYQISLVQFEDIKDYLSDICDYHMYQIGYSNCSTIMTGALKHAGFNIPETPRWVFRFGDIKVNPGDLGEDLRSNHAPGVFYSNNTFFMPPLSKCE